MFTLPDIQSKYPVGTTTFAIPVLVSDEKARVVGTAKLKRPKKRAARSATPATEVDDTRDEPALRLEEVAFTAFYPANVEGCDGKKTVGWIPEPVGRLVQGYAYFKAAGMFMRVLAYLFGGLARVFKFPAYLNARLLDPACREDAPGEAWPLMIFSHGLAGTRTSYTHFCSRVASEGRVVLALEHRDRSSPFAWTRSPIPGDTSDNKRLTEPMMYARLEEVQVEDEQGIGRWAFKTEQLLFRRIEVYLAHSLFQEFVGTPYDRNLDRPDPDKLHTVDGPWNFKLQDREKDRMFWESWTLDKEGRPRIQCSKDVTLAGHSFGAATVLHLLSQPPPMLEDREFVPLPVTRALVLDPWIEPLPSAGPMPHAVESSFEEHPRVPPELLVINSEQFTLWKEHFSRVKGVVDVWNSYGDSSSSLQRARLLTIVRSKHVWFSDFLLFSARPRMNRDARRTSDVIIGLSRGLLEGKMEEVLAQHRVLSDELESQSDVGELGDVVVHA